MPHPCDHPAAAMAITRSLNGQMQKAKQAGDLAAAQAIEAAMVRARRIVAQTQPRPPARPIVQHVAPPPPAQEREEGWAEIVEDRRSHRQRQRW